MEEGVVPERHSHRVAVTADFPKVHFLEFSCNATLGFGRVAHNFDRVSPSLFLSKNAHVSTFVK